jgi:uncharacterized membrane protein YcaP (DUF421 family)
MATAWGVLDAVLGLSATSAEQLSTLQACARAVVVFIVLIAYLKIGKKRFLGKATAFDAVLVIVIGSIASRAISGTAPFVASLAATLTLVLFHWLISLLARGSRTLSFLIKGRDTLIIKDGRVFEDALRNAHMSKDDLDEDMRQRGVEDPAEVKEARLERSGRLSIIRSPRS